jgi:phage RecT family recombinase
VFRSELDIKAVLAGEYRKQIENYFGDPEKALEFLSGVVADVQRLPALLECTPATLINSYIVMAQLKFMPSKVSGEAYVLPYKNKGVLEAQFQLGYQGIVTLLYRAGNRSVVAEIVRKNDIFRLINGSIHHEVDPLKTREERGEAIGVYAIITTAQGGKAEKFMRAEEIIGMAKKFSKSYFEYDYQTKKQTENVSKYTPWNEVNDPELWMWRKTVLKQAAKLAPKNETLNLAIAEDNKDSIIQDRIEAASKESGGLKMGALLESKKDMHEKESDESGEDHAPEGDPDKNIIEG